MGGFNEKRISGTEIRIDARAREEAREQLLRDNVAAESARPGRVTEAPTTVVRLTGTTRIALDSLSLGRPHLAHARKITSDTTAATHTPLSVLTRPRAVPPPLPKTESAATQGSALEARLEARAFVDSERRSAAAKSYHLAFPNDKAMPVTLEQVKAKLDKLGVFARTTFLNAIAEEGLGAVRQGYRMSIEADQPARHSTLEAVMQKAIEVNRQGRLLEALIPAGPDHVVVTGVLETARDNLRKTMAHFDLTGGDAAMLPLIKSLAEMQDALEITGKETFDRDGAAMLAKYSSTLRSLRANVAMVVENPTLTLKNFNAKHSTQAAPSVAQANTELRVAGSKVFEKLDTDSVLALGKAQAGVSDALSGSKARLMYRLLALRDTVHALLSNPRVPAHAMAALRKYSEAVASMMDAGR